jgi:translation elongation factor EF-4
MKKIIILLTLVFFAGFVFAQQQVTVQVRDAKNGTPIPNASVRIKASNKGATTNKVGVATIQANTNDVLEISNIGYMIQTITGHWSVRHFS